MVRGCAGNRERKAICPEKTQVGHKGNCVPIQCVTSMEAVFHGLF